MNRMICSLIAAGAAALAVASPAHAQPLPRAEKYGRAEYRWERAEARRWRELDRARRSFYARWNGNPWERARFEHWYARRCEELRYRGW
jgi:hypothetical protein